MKFGSYFQDIKKLIPSAKKREEVIERWREAQHGEFIWWAEVAELGYAGRNREEFISEGQRLEMLGALGFLEKPIDSWKDGTVVEFGSGPAGVVEYIQAKRKVAIEPLIDHYRKVFPHLSTSEVEYWNCPAEEISRNLSRIADLVICFNMLDHTRDPERVVRNLGRVAKPGADLLFQVNVYLTEEQARAKPEVHAKLHPHSLFPEMVLDLLKKSGFRIWKQFLSEEQNANGENYFICAGVNTRKSLLESIRWR